MHYDKLTRRHFLQGVGCSLALPLLPSLMPSQAAAQTSSNSNKYFIAMQSDHGGVPMQDWAPVGGWAASTQYPDGQFPASVTEAQLYSGNASEGMDHRMHAGRLSDMLRSRAHSFNPTGEAELSKVLSHHLNPYLDRCNLINGLDIMFYIAHHSSGILGGFNTTTHEENNTDFLFPSMPTIDQVMANSASFYPSGDTFSTRSITLGDSLSYSGNLGSVEPLVTHRGTLSVYDALFGADYVPSGGAVDPKLSSLVDRVLQDYNRTMNSSRISANDRQRLEAYIDSVNEAYRRAQNLAGASCNLSRPSQDVRISWNGGESAAQEAANWQANLDVVIAAMKCGQTRIATMNLKPFSDQYSGDWHQDIAHRQLSDIWYDNIIKSNRFVAEHIYTYILEQLNESIDGESDTTYLDNALVLWGHECGQYTHQSESMPILMAGSAGGAIATGNYLDYRNLSSNSFSDERDPIFMPLYNIARRPGLPYNRFLKNILDAMGIPESDYKVGALSSMHGYADPYVGQESWWQSREDERYPARIRGADMDLPLPGLFS